MTKIAITLVVPTTTALVARADATMAAATMVIIVATVLPIAELNLNATGAAMAPTKTMYRSSMEDVKVLPIALAIVAISLATTKSSSSPPIRFVTLATSTAPNILVVSFT